MLTQVGIGYEQDGVPQIVEGEHSAEYGEDHVVQLEVVGAAGGNVLYQTDPVISQITNGAAGESRQALHLDGLVGADQILQGRHRVSAPLSPTGAHLLQGDTVVPRAEHPIGPDPEKGVARRSLAPLYALEEKAVTAALRSQLHVGGNGGLRVRQDLHAHGNHVSPRSQLAKFSQCRFGFHALCPVYRVLAMKRPPKSAYGREERNPSRLRRLIHRWGQSPR